MRGRSVALVRLVGAWAKKTKASLHLVARARARARGSPRDFDRGLLTDVVLYGVNDVFGPLSHVEPAAGAGQRWHSGWWWWGRAEAALLSFGDMERWGL